MNYSGVIILKQTTRKYLLLFSIAGLIIITDQITKAIVRANLVYGEAWMPWTWLAPFARILHVKNMGAAFGLFQSGGTVLGVLAFVVAVVIIYYFPQIPDNEKLLQVALSMQLGGAVGNLIDRLTIGHVTDFISIGTFPVFNVADANITVGVGVLLLGMWISERKALKAARLPDERVDADSLQASENDTRELDA